MKCKICGNEINPEELGRHATGEFCSRSCVTKNNRSKVNDNELKQSECIECGKEIWIKKRASPKLCKCDDCRLSSPKGSEMGREKDLDDILLGKHPQYTTYKLKGRLIKSGYKEHKCEKCGLTEGNSEKVPIILDHINGCNWDHRWKNLQILCPNCNAQTPYNTGKNKRKKNTEVSDEQLIQALKENKNIRQALISLGLEPNGSGNYNRARRLIEIT